MLASTISDHDTTPAVRAWRTIVPHAQKHMKYACYTSIWIKSEIMNSNEQRETLVRLIRVGAVLYVSAAIANGSLTLFSGRGLPAAAGYFLTSLAPSIAFGLYVAGFTEPFVAVVLILPSLVLSAFYIFYRLPQWIFIFPFFGFLTTSLVTEIRLIAFFSVP